MCRAIYEDKMAFYDPRGQSPTATQRSNQPNGGQELIDPTLSDPKITPVATQDPKPTLEKLIQDLVVRETGNVNELFYDDRVDSTNV